MRISDWSSDVCSSDLPYPDRVADLFLAIAERSSNCEIVASIAALGDRLQLSRHFDAMILADVEAEYRRIEAAVPDAEPQAQIRTFLLGYHERRAHEAASARKHIVSGIGVAVRVARGGRRFIK